MTAEKLWAGRFSSRTDKAVEAFTASIQFDSRLFHYDIMGSIAHCRMLEKQKIIPVKDARRIIKALKEIEKEIERGEACFGPEHEDIHMFIESRLIEKVGPAGGKLHTARSRNDQVALDTRLFLRDTVIDIASLICRLQSVILDVSEKHLEVIMPGFTHLQHAQPVLFSHHMMAYFEMFKRDRERMLSCFGRVNVMPLGAGALAGTPYDTDRHYVAKLLGFPSVTANSMDSVSDRDFIIEFCSNASMIMMHLSRFCEELILWASPEFQFVEISDDFCTGSSIMPQKKNPDVPEIIRGKTGRVYGNLVASLTMMKALPLTYNRDLQEDKEALFDTVDVTVQCLNIFAMMLEKTEVKRDKMAMASETGFLTATDLADYLVRKGLPFRSAHKVAGRIVSRCLETGRNLWDIPVEELKTFSPEITEDVTGCLSLQASINNRKVVGATGRRPVKAALAKAKRDLARAGITIDRLRQSIKV